MAGSYVEELAAFLGWEVDSKDLASFEDQTKSVTDTVKGVAVAVGVAAAAVSAFVTVVNKATAVQTYMARANEVNARSVEDWGRMLSAVGGSVQSVTKNFVFLNKTMGAIKSGAVSATIVQKALKSVNLELSEFKKLNAEEQFKTVLQAAKDVEDVQVGQAAAVALLGRDAGKTVGYLRLQSKSVEELLAVQTKMNLQTEAGRNGAVRFFGALDLLEAAADSTKESIAGLVGEGVAPLMESMVAWIAANQELLKAKIKIWADRITKALTWLAGKIRWLITWVKKLVDDMGGLEQVAKLVGIAVTSMIAAKTLIAFVQFAKVVKAATLAATLMNAAVGLTPLLIAGVIALLFLLGEDLYQFFTGGDSLLGDIGEKIADFAHMEVRPFIASLLGMTPEEFDMAVVKVTNRIAKFFTQDIPDMWSYAVNAVTDLIQWGVESAWPLFLKYLGYAKDIGTKLIEYFKPMVNEIYLIFKDMWDSMSGYLWSVANTIKDALIWPFEQGYKIIKKILGAVASIPGGKTLTGLVPGFNAPEGLPQILPGSGAAPRGSGLGVSGVARAAAASASNRNNTKTGDVNQNNTFNVTQSPGESGENFARRVKDIIGGEVSRAVVATESGVE